MTEVLILLATLFFVSSFKLFTKPSTARNANILAATGMLVGVALTIYTCLLYTSPSPRDRTRYRMPSSA